MGKPNLVFSGMMALDKLDGISLSGRLRPVSEKSVASLMVSINELGVMQDAVHLRQKRSGELVLLKGAHRIEAARRLEWNEIEAKVWTNVTDDWSRLMEIDDNLAGGDLDALDMAVFMAERKKLHLKLHPETARGVAGAMARWDANEPSSVAFSKTIAEARGITERQVRKIAWAGASLSRDEIRWLRKAPNAVTLKDIEVLARIDDEHERAQVCIALSNGKAKKAAEARKQYAAATGNAPAPKDPIEQALETLVRDWDRTPMAARRRFISAIAGDIDALREGGDG